ncbi:TPA: hypothetical protein ACXDAY_002233 [Clostridium botulinum]|nr:hypothetical protein [Clostridium botulinum]APR02400.1 hypothetical protein RSJ2_3947 [Clostridium botulinum]AUN01475.1 hypothetical protein RSJ19_00390 [Clostridium botulinum]MBN3352062.1 hypothetical protein [Clostridium botulinum]MBN3359203.1 hypothetical protein [Clostridium botulinum]MBN3367024.1 hypothetical protein [Clostridium botulinum]
MIIIKILNQILKKVKKNKIENLSTNRKIKLSDNKAIYCEHYKNNICLLDNEECCLKKTNDEGITFDCYKTVYDK